MALISCPECNKEISDKAVSCPNCGYPIADSSSIIKNEKIEPEHELQNTEIKIEEIKCPNCDSIYSNTLSECPICLNKRNANIRKKVYYVLGSAILFVTVAFSVYSILNMFERDNFIQVYENYKQIMSSADMSIKLLEVDNSIISASIEPTFEMTEEDNAYTFYEHYTIEINIEDDIDSWPFPEQFTMCKMLDTNVGIYMRNTFRESDFAKYLGNASIENGSKFKNVYGVDSYFHHMSFSVTMKTSSNKYVYSTDINDNDNLSINSEVYSGQRLNNLLAGRDENYVEPTPEPVKVPPSIGMTADEVRASTWGYPKDINKTTTAYGVKEQWIYPDYKYIYFEDGIVEAIQE